MKQTLVVIRHGKARSGDDDDARPLSDKGRDRFAATVGALWRLDVRLDLLLHSPKLRAVQSAELLAPLLDGSSQVTSALARTPDAELLGLLDAPSVGVVGHKPWLSELVAWLAIGQRARARVFRIGKAGVAVLQGRVEPGGMRVRCLWTARDLRTLAG